MLAARDAVLALREQWDDGLASRAFSANQAASFLSLVHDDLAWDQKEHGKCHLRSTSTDGPHRLRWDIACEHGLRTTWIDTTEGRIAAIQSWDGFPPDPRLATAAARLVSLVERWDGNVYDALIAPGVDRSKIRDAFGQSSAEHGRCKVDHADENGDKTNAVFVLSCARGGPLELHAALDEKSGKVTDVTLRPPPEPNTRCP